MSTISVVIPAYNAERTILATLKSVLNQTFSDFELIVINDGSTDRTSELLSTIDDARLKVFSYENGGLPTARNRGIANATGDFISFIDADDLWTSDKLERQLAALEQKPEAGVAYSWTRFIDEAGNLLYNQKPKHIEGNVYPRLLINNFIFSGSNILVRRQYIDSAGEFDPTLKSAEDWDYYLKLAAQCSFVLVPDYQILYRRSTQSMTSKVDVMEKNILMVIDRAYECAPQELQPLKKQALARAHWFLAKIHLTYSSDSNEIKKARQKLLHAIQIYPKTLFDRDTQRLILKLLTSQLLPTGSNSNFLHSFIKLFARKSSQNRPLSKDNL